MRLGQAYSVAADPLLQLVIFYLRVLYLPAHLAVGLFLAHLTISLFLVCMAVSLFMVHLAVGLFPQCPVVVSFFPVRTHFSTLL